MNIQFDLNFSRSVMAICFPFFKGYATVPIFENGTANPVALKLERKFVGMTARMYLVDITTGDVMYGPTVYLPEDTDVIVPKQSALYVESNTSLELSVTMASEPQFDTPDDAYIAYLDSRGFHKVSPEVRYHAPVHADNPYDFDFTVGSILHHGSVPKILLWTSKMGVENPRLVGEKELNPIWGWSRRELYIEDFEPGTVHFAKINNKARRVLVVYSNARNNEVVVKFLDDNGISYYGSGIVLTYNPVDPTKRLRACRITVYRPYDHTENKVSPYWGDDYMLEDLCEIGLMIHEA